MTKKLKANLAEYLSNTRFRANPNYELVLFDHLNAEEQEIFRDLQKQSDFYGILRPTESSNLSVKSVPQDTALLYFSLGKPGKLPAYAKAIGGEAFEKAIAKFVIDQILEIENDGEFVSGAKAYELFYQNSNRPEPTTRIEQLSIDALRYGQALSLADITDLSIRLYHYHCIPISNRWQRKFSGPEAVADLIGVGPNGKYRRSSHWQQTPISANKETESANSNGSSAPHAHGSENESSNITSWLSWTSRKDKTKSQNNKSTFKLYVSPLPEFIFEVFTSTFVTLGKTNAFHLKVGADAPGLLRPDKMVAYFHSQDDLRKAAELLANELKGCPAHGVPFTAEIAGDGLLSWGVDPPEGKQLLSWQPQESWRLWLTNRLANALVSVRNSKGDGSTELEPWEYALDRLSLEGVDTRFWTPAQKMWN